jgi:hypothetical protein
VRPPRHGTSLGYSTDGCRCNRCRAAWRLYKRQTNWRAGRHRPHDEAVAARYPNGITHGLRATYTNGCRCDDCRDAERVYKAEYRQRRRTAP